MILIEDERKNNEYDLFIKKSITNRARRFAKSEKRGDHFSPSLLALAVI